MPLLKVPCHIFHESSCGRSFHPLCVGIFDFAENSSKERRKFCLQSKIARHRGAAGRTTKPAMTVLRDISDPGCRLLQCFRQQFRFDLRSRFENLAQAGYDMHSVLTSVLIGEDRSRRVVSSRRWMFALNGSFFACKDKAFNRISDFIATACWAREKRQRTAAVPWLLLGGSINVLDLWRRNDVQSHWSSLGCHVDRSSRGSMSFQISRYSSLMF